MRLLERRNGGFHLTEDLTDTEIPSYAILSHTWGHRTEEVTFMDMKQGTGRHKVGYDKIEFCGGKASQDGIEYFWVDSCCIDKSSSAELQEAITCMFHWYQRAAKCYIYLADVSKTQYSGWEWKQAFRASRWFTRGWTLQELLAPRTVEFFSRQGQLLGDKEGLEDLIQETTGIDATALRGTPISQFDIDMRFTWARHRHTTRPEDGAYSLLGIFGIFIPIMYGEGRDNAINRLKKEISEASKGNMGLMPQSHTSHKAVTRSSRPKQEWSALHTLKAHDEKFGCLEFSADGKTLASGGSSPSNAVMLWEVSSATVLWTAMGHTYEVEYVAFLPDGRTLASASLRTFRLWELQSGAALKTFTVEGGFYALSPDRKMVPSFSGEHSYPVKIWDIQSGIVVQEFDRLDKFQSGDRNYVIVSFSPDSSIIALSDGPRKTIRLLDVRSAALLRTIKPDGYYAHHPLFSPDCMTMALISGHNHLLQDFQSGKVLHTLKGVWALAFSSDGSKVATAGSEDETIGGETFIFLWDVRSGRLLRQEKAIDPVYGLLFSPDSKTLVSISHSTVRLWNSESGAALKAFTGDNICQGFDWNTKTVFSPDGKMLASVAFHDGIRLWS